MKLSFEELLVCFGRFFVGGDIEVIEWFIWGDRLLRLLEMGYCR